MPDVSDRKNRLRLLLLGLFLVALLPRLSAINRYVTPDELAWVFRSVRFREALLDHRWADTLVSGHPGVCTTWLGALGISVQLLLRPADQLAYEWITQLAWLAPENTAALSQLSAFLTSARLVMVLVNSVGLILFFLLLRPLMGRRVALWAGFLLALNPFVAGLSGLLHVDGLTTTFATLSLLALANGVFGTRKGVFLAAAGLLAALAALSKSSALLLGPFSALVLFIWLLRGERWRRPGIVIGQGLAWLLAFVVALLATLPALWVSPVQVLETVLGAAATYSGGALHAVFFWGDYVARPGPLYYLVTLPFRLSPVIFIGLVLFSWLVLFKRWRAGRRLKVAGLLSLWTILLLVGLSIVQQKFSRYALLVVPALVIIAALAWNQTLHAHKIQTWGKGLLALQALWLLFALPYPLTVFNPLLGGGGTAAKVLNIDWGEGASAAADWLADQPGADEAVVMASALPAAACFFPGQVIPVDALHLTRADYLILSVVDRQIDPSSFAQLAAVGELVHTARFNGRDQAWVYALPGPRSAGPAIPVFSSPFTFDRRVELLGVNTYAALGQAHLLAKWGLLQANRYTIKVTLADEEGHRWGGMETPLLNQVFFYPENWTAGETPELDYIVQLPVGIPPADYQLQLSLFETESVAQLPLLAADGEFRGVVYTQSVTILPLAKLPSISSLNLVNSLDATWAHGDLRLLGQGPLPGGLSAGEKIAIDLYWQAAAELPDELRLRLGLGEEHALELPLSRYPTGRWRLGELIHEKYLLPVPPNFTSGRYLLWVMLVAADGTLLDGPPVGLGELQINQTDRLFQLPADLSIPLAVQLDSVLRLRGADLPTTEVSPGGVVDLTLYWQAEAQPDQAYTAFVHVVNQAGEIVAQVDRWPANSPSDTWAADQVIVDEYAIALPTDVPPGTFQLRVGLYNAISGVRLLVLGPEHVAHGDYLLLPVTLEVR